VANVSARGGSTASVTGTASSAPDVSKP
jgi:hypothetical protein